MPRALDVPSVIAGEAVSGSLEDRWNDMVNIASVIANRAQLLGVSMQDVIANTNEFNAYNNPMPAGTQNLTDLAQQAIDYVAENGPVNNATFYATPVAADNLPGGLNYEGATTGHQYYSDPHNRAIGTANGYVQPNPYAYAANPANVPTPYAADDLTNNSLLSAFSATPTYKDDPFSAVLGPQQPTTNQWADMAAAAPVSSPMGSVQATGLLGGVPAMEAQTRAVPMMDVPASGLLAGNAPLDAAATASLLSNATPSERMGIAEPGFDPGRFDAMAPAVASVDASRFASAPKTDRIGTSQTMEDAARMNPLTGAIDPATNTQSFMDQPSTPADLGNMPAAYAAQRGPTSGILSADHQAVQGAAEMALSRAMAQQPQMSLPASGLLAGTQPFAATATVPALATPTLDQAVTPSVPGLTTPTQTAFAAEPSVTPAEQAINANFAAAPTSGLLSPTQITNQTGPLSFTPSRGILAAQPQQQNAFVSAFPSAVANNTIEPATINDVVTPPTLDTIQVADQPTIAEPSATFEGPATTPALTQQKTAAVNNAFTPNTQTQPTVQAAQNTKSFKDSLFSKETAIGGLLGGMALGPVGGILGALSGQQVAANGGLTGLLSGGFTGPTTQIPGGIANIGGIYGGMFSPGTYAMANNGAQITSLGGGYTGMVTPSGQHEVMSPTGQLSHNFGGLFSNTTDTDTDAEAA